MKRSPFWTSKQILGWRCGVVIWQIWRGPLFLSTNLFIFILIILYRSIHNPDQRKGLSISDWEVIVLCLLPRKLLLFLTYGLNKATTSTLFHSVIFQVGTNHLNLGCYPLSLVVDWFFFNFFKFFLGLMIGLKLRCWCDKGAWKKCLRLFN